MIRRNINQQMVFFNQKKYIFENENRECWIFRYMHIFLKNNYYLRKLITLTKTYEHEIETNMQNYEPTPLDCN